MIFQWKSPALECADVLDPSVALSLPLQPTSTIPTSAQGTWLKKITNLCKTFVCAKFCPNHVSRCGAKVFEAEKVATGVGPFHKSCYRCSNQFPCFGCAHLNSPNSNHPDALSVKSTWARSPAMGGQMGKYTAQCAIRSYKVLNQSRALLALSGALYNMMRHCIAGL